MHRRRTNTWPDNSTPALEEMTRNQRSIRAFLGVAPAYPLPAPNPGVNHRATAQDIDALVEASIRLGGQRIADPQLLEAA
jgi:hypothetical protein